MQVILLDAVTEFLDSLQETELAKTIHTIELLEEFGNMLGMPHSKHMNDGLLELRVRGKREIRLLYCFHNRKVVILHGFIKKTQKTSPREISKAKALLLNLH